MKKYAILATLCLAVGAGNTTGARADTRDVIGGVILGIGIGAAINANKKKKTTQRSTKSATKKSPTQRGDAQVQAALNFYGFNAGTPDGVFGPATRGAISRYQAALGVAQTGKLTAAETSALLSAYARDAAKGMPGVVGAPAAGNGQMTTLLASLAVQDALTGSAAPAASTEIQTEIAGPRPQALCETDAAATPSEAETIVGSYCSALGFAVNRSLALTAKVPAFDAALSAKQCNDWLAANSAALTAALAQPPEAAVPALAALAPSADPAQQAALRDSFTICHGVSEAAGNPDAARSYAALVAATGGGGYGELVAASAALGLGTVQSGQSASDWYLWTAEALDGGSAKLIDTADYDHVPLLLALSGSALANGQNWQAVLAARAAPAPATTGLALPGLPAPQPAATTGLALPGLPAVATEAASPASALPANFEQVYGMSVEAALTACRKGGAAIADLGRVTCRSLAASVNDPLLAAQYQ